MRFAVTQTAFEDNDTKPHTSRETSKHKTTGHNKWKLMEGIKCQYNNEIHAEIHAASIQKCPGNCCFFVVFLLIARGESHF